MPCRCFALAPQGRRLGGLSTRTNVLPSRSRIVSDSRSRGRAGDVRETIGPLAGRRSRSGATTFADVSGGPRIRERGSPPPPTSGPARAPAAGRGFQRRSVEQVAGAEGPVRGRRAAPGFAEPEAVELEARDRPGPGRRACFASSHHRLPRPAQDLGPSSLVAPNGSPPFRVDDETSTRSASSIPSFSLLERSTSRPGFVGRVMSTPPVVDQHEPASPFPLGDDLLAVRASVPCVSWTDRRAGSRVSRLISVRLAGRSG